MRTASGWRAAGSRPSAAAPNALSANDGGARGGGLPGAEGILVAIDARAHLPRFVGRPVHTIRQDQPNRVIAVDRPDVVVATHRSPAEQRIAIAEARPAMDILERTRDPLADRNIVGYRSAFIEAVLATSPRVPVPTRPWPYQALTAFERLKLGMSNLPPHLIGPEPPRPVHRRRGGIRLRPCWRLLRLPGQPVVADAVHRRPHAPPLLPSEYRTLLDVGIELTDVCKIASNSAPEVGKGRFDIPRFVALVEASRSSDC
jgi:hypothetical protein